MTITAEDLYQWQTYESLRELEQECPECAEAEFAKWTRIRVFARHGRPEVEPYLGFGARFIDDETVMVRPEHVEWLRGRLGSGLIGSRVLS